MSNPLTISNADQRFPSLCRQRLMPANVTPIGTVKTFEERLAEDHLAARFERVQRRWEAKHRPTVIMSRWDLRETF